jgi:hypothetical protein
MDPNITKCSVEVMEEGHGADASSTGAIGAGPNSKWRYNACKLTHPIELAAGMAFLIEHSIADARYKVCDKPGWPCTLPARNQYMLLHQYGSIY